MLSDVIAAMNAALTGVAGDERIPDAPPDQLGDYPKLLIYPQPGRWIPHAHAGDDGGPLYAAEHTLVVEWHTRRNDLAQAVTETTPVADAIPLALLRDYAAHRLNESVTTIEQIRCETFGELGWGSDQTFGVRVLVDVTLIEEVPS